MEVSGPLVGVSLLKGICTRTGAFLICIDPVPVFTVAIAPGLRNKKARPYGIWLLSDTI